MANWKIGLNTVACEGEYIRLNISWIAGYAQGARQLSTWRRIGWKLRCIRSTPTDRLSSSEKCFECFARTGL